MMLALASIRMSNRFVCQNGMKSQDLVHGERFFKIQVQIKSIFSLIEALHLMIFAEIKIRIFYLFFEQVLSVRMGCSNMYVHLQNT